MKAKTFGFVASLIAALTLLGASQAVHAQQPLWANAQTVKAIEYGTRDEAGNCQVLSNGQVSCRYYLSAKVDEITALDDYATRPGLQLKRTGETIVGFAPGTPGTVTMRKLMFCLGGKVNNDPSLPEAQRAGAVKCGIADTVYSHVLTPEKVRASGLSETLVDNPSIAYFTQNFWDGYVEDQDDIGIAFVLPYKQTLFGKEFTFCPTGTREIRKWYNAAYQRSTTLGQINDGNWRFSNNFAWRDGTLPKGYEQSYDDEVLCGPAEVKAVWVTSAFPTDYAVAPDGWSVGKYVSRFNLGATATTVNTVDHVVSSETNRQNWFDNSRKIFYSPAYQPTRIVTAKSFGLPPSLPVSGSVEANRRNRLGVYVHERTGRVYQLGTTGWSMNAVLVSPANSSSDLNPKVLVQSAAGDAADVNPVEANIAGHIEDDLFFRLLGVNSFATARLEVYDARVGEVGAKIAEYAIPFQLSLAGNTDAHRPKMTLDAKRGELYILNVQHGRLFALNLAAGSTREVIIANQGGDNMADVAIDTSRDVLYVTAIETLGNSRNANNRYAKPSRLLEQSIVSGLALREARTAGVGWVLALSNVGSKATIFVLNPGVAPSRLQEFDVVTLTVRRETNGEQQPCALSLEFQD